MLPDSGQIAWGTFTNSSLINQHLQVIESRFTTVSLYKLCLRFKTKRVMCHILSDYAEPKFFFRSTVTPPTNKKNCCSGTICTSVTEVNMEVLKFGPTKYPTLYIPRYPLPSEDLSEVFTISFTEPPSCKSSLCDLYYYQNYKKESLTITVTGNIIDGHLETGEGSPDLVLKECNNDYVWTEKMVAKKGITGVRALPGPACWYPQEYCDPLHNVISYTMKEEGPHEREDLVLECYQACQSLSNCHHFTYMAIRGKGDCYLLSDCKKTSDTCLKLGTCTSGPSDCAPWPDNGECSPPPQLNGDFNKWQCIDKEVRKFQLFVLTIILEENIKVIS